nr:retrovirus-related Pol polyprotein from transposon TNT 1-94 [Tanacetum cinerariifolium]
MNNTCGPSKNTKFAKQSILGKPPMLGEIHALSKPVTSHLVSTPQESKVMNNDKVIAPGMFRINPFKTSREEKHMPNSVRASAKTKPITVSHPSVITKKDVNSDSNGLSSTGLDNTKTRRPQPRSNTKNDRVPSASKSSRSKNKEAEVEEYHRNLLLSKNTKHMSSACNNIKLDSQNIISKVVCVMCKQYLISVNHDVCLHNYVNGKTSRGKKLKANVLVNDKQKKHQPQVKKPKKFMGTVHFGNDHVVAILGFGDLQWGNILITRVYFVEGLGHNLFSVGQFCDSDLEVVFRRNACFVRNLEGVDLLKEDRSINLYTINLHEMAYVSPICLMARASSTKLWLWHQRLSHLNFDTINDLARNDLVSSLPKFKYNKEHLCPSCEQGKTKKASHPPKPVPNSRQRLHLLHMDLCGPMRIASINGKWYVLVILDDYSRYTWSPVIIIRTNNGTEFKNQVLKEYFDYVGISHQMSSVRTPQQNGVVERRNRTLVETARTMLVFSRAPLFLWAEAIATECFTQNRTTQAQEIDSLKKRVKKLERRKRSRTHGLKRLYKVGLSARVKSFEDEGLDQEDASKQGRIADIDANKDIYLVNVHNDKDIFGINDLDDDEVIIKDAEMLFDVADDLSDEEVFVSQEVPLNVAAATTTTPTIDDITLAQALAELKSAKPKAAITTAATTITTASSRPKANGLVFINKTQRLQAKEQEELTDSEKAKLFMQFLERRRKFFAAKRAKEKRNRPPTQAQQRKIMCTYLKNIERKKLTDLKNKSFDSIKKMFDRAFKRVNTFVDFRTELVEESSKKSKAEVMKRSSKRARTKLKQEKSKK